MSLDAKQVDRLIQMLEVNLRPGFDAFIETEVLVNAGPDVRQVTIAMVKKFADLVAEMLSISDGFADESDVWKTLEGMAASIFADALKLEIELYRKVVREIAGQARLNS